MNLADLLNHFQTGKVGHLALVCARPKLAQEALDEGRPLPQPAGLMGIISIEDVLESLLQEEIYDETDRIDREAARLARWAAKKWKRFVENKKRRRIAMEQQQEISMEAVVVEAMEAAQHHQQQSDDGTSPPPGEGTSLLGGGDGGNNNPAGIFGFLGDVFKNEK